MIIYVHKRELGLLDYIADDSERHRIRVCFKYYLMYKALILFLLYL